MEAVAAPGRIGLELLGGWRLAVGGRPAAAPAYEKGRALLAYLAIENRWLSRDALGSLFWPDSFGHRANLRQVLANLRAVLQDNDAALPYLLVRRDAICINGECGGALDVDAFLALPPRCGEPGSAQRCAPCLRRMEQAENLYRGEFMAGFSLADCPEFEEWLRRKREALHRHAVALCSRLADCHEKYGDPASALTFARRTTELDPWDEAAQRRLMRLLAANGQSAAALRQYETLEASLARDIGVAPEEATRALHQRIRAGDGAAAGPDTRGDAATPMAPADGGAAAPCSDEVRRVVVLQVEPDLDDEAELLEPEPRLVPLDAAFDAALLRWHGQRFPTTGVALGAVFGLADDGEQAPRRALRAALELSALPEFRHTRIGICEGKALVGPRARRSIADSALPALAQRLALCGERGDVIAVESLAGELGPRAHFETLPRRRFTGLAGEHAPCRLLATPGTENAPYPATFATPFVGRRDEHARLAAALGAAESAGRVVFVEVTGLPGTGKSRLLAELAREHAAAGGEIRWVAHRPELRHVSLGALRESLRRRIDAADSAAGGSAGLDDWLERLFPPERKKALRAALRSFLALESDATEDVSGRSLVDALLTVLFAPSGCKRPVLLVFDDLHWADEATREMLRIAMQTQPAAPILALLAGRPAAGIASPEGIAMSRIVLQPLAMTESLALIAAIDPDGSIDGARRTQLARTSGGLPLYAEYIARTARDQPVSDASLFGVLQSVLDRLGPDKQVLQAAAVLGASFCGAALSALLPQCDPAAALLRAEALAISARTGEDEYAFRHALLRDCAYDSIPPKLRRDWHRRAAVWLSRQVDAAPADIAQHFEAAQAWREARDSWWQAAQEAYLGEFARDAKEAVARAFAAAAKDSVALAPTDKAELELLAGYATLMAEGYGAKEAQQFFAPLAAQTAGQLPDETLFRTLSGLAAATPLGRSETLAIMQRLDSMVHTPVHRMMVCYGFGSLLFWRGEFAESLRYFDEAIDLGETIPAREWLRYSADNPVVACRALKGINLAFSGAAPAAMEAAARAVADARHEGRAHGLCFALTMAASVHLVLDRPNDTERLAAEGLELASQRHFQLWWAYNTMFGLWAKARQGRLRLSASFKLVSMHREFTAASRLSPVTALWFAGTIFEALGHWSLADATAGKALALAENGGDRYCMPDLMRQKALARHARGDLSGARRWHEQALALAKSLGSHGLMPRLERAAERYAPAAGKDAG